MNCVLEASYELFVVEHVRVIMVTGSIHGGLADKGVTLLRPDGEGFLQRYHIGRVRVCDAVVVVSMALGQRRDYDLHQGMVKIVPGRVGTILLLGLVSPDYNHTVMLVSRGIHDHRHYNAQEVVSLRDLRGIAGVVNSIISKSAG